MEIKDHFHLPFLSKSAVTSVTTPTVTNLPTAQQQPTLNPSTTLNNEQAPPTYTGADIPTVLPDFLNSGNRAKFGEVGRL
ncbi:12964_t:CDS:2 [Gigaspora margarita]|uniref:12964_t:CDS:1 n=1 Tax=Gigaspora margarita TaxID=4874 RepID=A0ABN7UMI7_GIGMA|nr:12964_t:CDS:2 [Gigaspora margarita]